MCKQDMLEVIQNPDVVLWRDNPEFPFCSWLFIITEYFLYGSRKQTEPQQKGKIPLLFLQENHLEIVARWQRHL